MSDETSETQELRTITGKLIRVIRLDAVGNPVGEPIELNEAVVFHVADGGSLDDWELSKVKWPYEATEASLTAELPAELEDSKAKPAE